MKKALILLIIACLGGLALWRAYLPGGEPGALLSAALTPPAEKVLPEEVVKTIRGETAGNQRQAAWQVVEFTLDRTGLNHWLETGLLKYGMSFGNIHPAGGEELIAAVSMGKDDGIVAVFTRDSRGYQLSEVVNDLVPVPSTGVLNLPGSALQALIVEQHLDEMAGAFFREKSKVVYLFQDDSYRKLWERATLREEYWPENNTGRWLMVKEEVVITFEPAGKIDAAGNKIVARGNSLQDFYQDYRIVQSHQIKESYVWDQKSRTFKISPN